MDASGANAPKGDRHSIQRVSELIESVSDPACLKSAVIELLEYRETVPDLACYIWYSYGTITVLLSQILSIYPLLTTGNLSTIDSHQVWACLTLLQSVASHPDTKHEFIKALMPVYLYPFLSIPAGNHKPNEFLRLTGLGILGAMVSGEDPVVFNFLLESDVIPRCLEIMQICSELSKNVATFIVLKVLLYDAGLAALFEVPEKFYAVVSVLHQMITSAGQSISVRLFKHILRFYLRLTEHPKGKQPLAKALPACLLTALETGYYDRVFAQDPSVRELLERLIKAVA
uniref:CCR4-NOT transcription complex subunit 9 n=1 Tax=Dermatophagoides pteronyssinus TaxID=6956 RepID=A0A6P6YKY5_DERPT|nr:CCR4-NOT transcription complex subunit 9-like [Dermatophagoides pteronyssinus]